MRIALYLSGLVAALACNQAMAAGGTIHFVGAIVEPSCQISLSQSGAAASRIQLNHCNQAPNARLSEPGNNQPSLHYRLTDAQGHALTALSADATNLVQPAALQAAAANRNVVLVLEYL